MIISRRQHPLLKELRDLRDKPQNDLLFLEGPKLLEEALQASIPIQTLVVSSTVQDSELLTKARGRAKNVFSVSDSIFRSISDLVEPQGVLAIGEKPRWTWEQVLSKSPAPILILDGLQNPGNVASILRTAEAAGAAGVITTPATARLTSPKALRGASGSSLRLPALEHQKPEDIADRLGKAGYKIYGTAAAAQTPGEIPLIYTDVDWTHPSAIVLGQEGNGISSVWNATGVTIPMQSPVESLNVGAAAAILLYETFHQRAENVK